MSRPSSFLACTLALVIAMPAMAQSETGPVAKAQTSRLFLGLGVNGATLKGDGADEGRSGGGLSFSLGWGFTPKIALVADLAGASMDGGDGERYGLGHADLAARFSLARAGHAFVPFVEAGLTGRAAVQRDVTILDDQGNPQTGDLSISGTGFTLGGGAQYFVAPSLALGASLKWTTGQFSRATFQNTTVEGYEIDANSTRFTFGLSWYPMAGR